MAKETQKFIEAIIIVILFLIAMLTKDYLWFISIILCFIYFKEEERRLNLTLILKKEEKIKESTKKKLSENAKKMPRGYHGRFISKKHSNKKNK